MPKRTKADTPGRTADVSVKSPRKPVWRRVHGVLVAVDHEIIEPADTLPSPSGRRKYRPNRTATDAAEDRAVADFAERVRITAIQGGMNVNG